MNFPGLEFSWKTFHRTLHGTGAIRPWTIDECRAEVSRSQAGVLVVATTALGDSLLCTPLVSTLSAALGPARTGLLVRDNVRALYEGDPRLGFLGSTRGKFRGLGAVREAMKGGPFRIALIANCTEPDLIPWLWWCGIRGFLRYRTRWSVWPDWFANRDQMRRPGEPDYATGHAIENNLAMAEALGLTPTSRRLSIHVTAEGEAKARAVLGEDAPGAAPLVLIHPGASRAEKCWPAAAWAEVARGLHHDFGCRFAVTGGPGERAMGDEVVALLPAGSRNIAGELPLPALAAAQRRAHLFISGDTGPYHLALAAGCPTVTLFAPRDRGSSTEACGPHLADPQRHLALETTGFHQPITTLAPEQVLAAARAVMSADE